MSIEASIKSTMQLFIKFSSGIILDSWSESNRSHLVAKLIFLDQVCDISPYVPRSSLESHASSTHGQDQYETESFSIRSIDNKHRNVRRSGPLDYSLSRKSKFIEGSTSASTGPSPLPRFAVSRSGPISYK
ncbi:UNVERIFIED_CONTAM: putative protein NAP1 [Sesamum radiatum]|uniref:Uncharacterized protein n=1 Tax=Sesamum radiatum TaxID=300843 RepID=A0AAW2SZI1_SESRA